MKRKASSENSNFKQIQDKLEKYINLLYQTTHVHFTTKEVDVDNVNFSIILSNTLHYSMIIFAFIAEE